MNEVEAVNHNWGPLDPLNGPSDTAGSQSDSINRVEEDILSVS